MAAFESADEWQSLSYALDLRDFHAESAGRNIVPILVLGGPTVGSDSLPSAAPDFAVMSVQRVRSTDGLSLADALLRIYSALHDADSDSIDAARWEASAYRPSPNIIEAAESLFAGHSVGEISHSFAVNLELTAKTLFQAIEQTQRLNRRTICFVTGTPGAGKTLAGLNAVHSPSMRRDDRPSAVFLSGNRPLVNVVREALIRNRVRGGADRRTTEQSVSAFINYVHGFIQFYGIRNPTQPPHEHAIVFDEAQRAWNADMVSSKHSIEKSEPQLILEIMERAPDWCLIVAIVGGGQEIHKGEAGLAEWGHALNASSKRWHVLVSGDAMRGGATVAGHCLFTEAPNESLQITEVSELHLDVGVRSPRAHWLVDWVNAVLVGEARPNARAVEESPFPIALTRDLAIAKRWLRDHADGVQRCGLLASSGALRLRAHGIEVSSGFRGGYNYSDWFLAPPNDCRSSSWLEVAGTEFECQGLELDWTGVCWGGDLTYILASKKWVARRFRGRMWQRVNGATEQQYTVNKYRVLLTRARLGMVIWVPRGDECDSTRSPDELDAVAGFLTACGLPMLD